MLEEINKAKEKLNEVKTEREKKALQEKKAAQEKALIEYERQYKLRDQDLLQKIAGLEAQLKSAKRPENNGSKGVSTGNSAPHRAEAWFVPLHHHNAADGKTSSGTERPGTTQSTRTPERSDTVSSNKSSHKPTNAEQHQPNLHSSSLQTVSRSNSARVLPETPSKGGPVESLARSKSLSSIPLLGRVPHPPPQKSGNSSFEIPYVMSGLFSHEEWVELRTMWSEFAGEIKNHGKTQKIQDNFDAIRKIHAVQDDEPELRNVRLQFSYITGYIEYYEEIISQASTIGDYKDRLLKRISHLKNMQSQLRNAVKILSHDYQSFNNYISKLRKKPVQDSIHERQSIENVEYAMNSTNDIQKRIRCLSYAMTTLSNVAEKDNTDLRAEEAMNRLLQRLTTAHNAKEQKKMAAVVAKQLAEIRGSTAHARPSSASGGGTASVGAATASAGSIGWHETEKKKATNPHTATGHENSENLDEGLSRRMKALGMHEEPVRSAGTGGTPSHSVAGRPRATSRPSTPLVVKTVSRGKKINFPGFRETDEEEIKKILYSAKDASIIDNYVKEKQKIISGDTDDTDRLTQQLLFSDLEVMQDEKADLNKRIRRIDDLILTERAAENPDFDVGLLPALIRLKKKLQDEQLKRTAAAKILGVFRGYKWKTALKTKALHEKNAKKVTSEEEEKKTNPAVTADLGFLHGSSEKSVFKESKSVRRLTFDSGAARSRFDAMPENNSKISINGVPEDTKRVLNEIIKALQGERQKSDLVEAAISSSQALLRADMPNSIHVKVLLKYLSLIPDSTDIKKNSQFEQWVSNLQTYITKLQHLQGKRQRPSSAPTSRQGVSGEQGMHGSMKTLPENQFSKRGQADSPKTSTLGLQRSSTPHVREDEGHQKKEMTPQRSAANDIVNGFRLALLQAKTELEMDKSSNYTLIRSIDDLLNGVTVNYDPKLRAIATKLVNIAEEMKSKGANRQHSELTNTIQKLMAFKSALNGKTQNFAKKNEQAPKPAQNNVPQPPPRKIENTMEDVISAMQLESMNHARKGDTQKGEYNITKFVLYWNSPFSDHSEKKNALNDLTKMASAQADHFHNISNDSMSEIWRKRLQIFREEWKKLSQGEHPDEVPSGIKQSSGPNHNLLSRERSRSLTMDNETQLSEDMTRANEQFHKALMKTREWVAENEKHGTNNHVTLKMVETLQKKKLEELDTNSLQQLNNLVVAMQAVRSKYPNFEKLANLLLQCYEMAEKYSDDRRVLKDFRDNLHHIDMTPRADSSPAVSLLAAGNPENVQYKSSVSYASLVLSRRVRTGGD